MSRKKHPTKELVEELDALFKKHNWSGQPIGITSASLSAGTNPCGPGEIPVEVTYKTETGEVIVTTICKKV